MSGWLSTLEELMAAQVCKYYGGERLTLIHPPNASANSGVKAIKLIHFLEVSSLGFKS